MHVAIKGGATCGRSAAALKQLVDHQSISSRDTLIIDTICCLLGY